MMKKTKCVIRNFCSRHKIFVHTCFIIANVRVRARDTVKHTHTLTQRNEAQNYIYIIVMCSIKSASSSKNDTQNQKRTSTWACYECITRDRKIYFLLCLFHGCVLVWRGKKKKKQKRSLLDISVICEIYPSISSVISFIRSHSLSFVRSIVPSKFTNQYIRIRVWVVCANTHSDCVIGIVVISSPFRIM